MKRERERERERAFFRKLKKIGREKYGERIKIQKKL